MMLRLLGRRMFLVSDQVMVTAWATRLKAQVEGHTWCMRGQRFREKAGLLSVSSLSCAEPEHNLQCAVLTAKSFLLGLPTVPDLPDILFFKLLPLPWFLCQHILLILLVPFWSWCQLASFERRCSFWSWPVQYILGTNYILVMGFCPRLFVPG